MALAFEIIATLSDESGDDATTTIKVPSGFSLSQYGEFAVAMSSLVDDMLSGRVDGLDLCLTADISGLTGNLVGAASDVEEVGRFQFRTVDGRPVKLNLPALNESLVAVGTDDLDLVDPAIAAIEAMMVDGIAVTLATITPCDVAEDDIVSLEFAREGFRP